MAESTIWGIGAIVVIVIVAGLFIYGSPGFSNANIAGQAGMPADVHVPGQAAERMSAGTACEPDRFCDGSKLTIVREDCSLAQAFCQRGCNAGAAACN